MQPPSHLPPLPEVEGYRWEYRGEGWKPGRACNYAVTDATATRWCMTFPADPIIPSGNPLCHYAEAVPLSPPDPPAEGAETLPPSATPETDADLCAASEYCFDTLVCNAGLARKLETERNEARAALKVLFSNPHINLGDLVYQVREREGEGWEGPSVKAWSEAVTKATAVLAASKP